MAAGLGFEPRQTDSESVVLPLHHPAIQEKYPNTKVLLGLNNPATFFNRIGDIQAGRDRQFIWA